MTNHRHIIFKSMWPKGERGQKRCQDDLQWGHLTEMLSTHGLYSGTVRGRFATLFTSFGCDTNGMLVDPKWMYKECKLRWQTIEILCMLICSYTYYTASTPVEMLSFDYDATVHLCVHKWIGVVFDTKF